MRSAANSRWQGNCHAPLLFILCRHCLCCGSVSASGRTLFAQHPEALSINCKRDLLAAFLAISRTTEIQRNAPKSGQSARQEKKGEREREEEREGQKKVTERERESDLYCCSPSLYSFSETSQQTRLQQNIKRDSMLKLEQDRECTGVSRISELNFGLNLSNFIYHLAYAIQP